MIVTPRIEETGHLRCSFDYMLYTPTSLSLFSLKNETEVFKGDQQLPLEILISTDRKLFFYVYDYWIDLVWVGLDSLGLQDSELQNRTSPAKRTFRVKVSRRIRSYYLWEEILFYTDDNDVWLCYPALYNSEPLKIKLASNFPSSKSQVGLNNS